MIWIIERINDDHSMCIEKYTSLDEAIERVRKLVIYGTPRVTIYQSYP